jgi:hypothetical protein
MVPSERPGAAPVAYAILVAFALIALAFVLPMGSGA